LKCYNCVKSQTISLWSVKLIIIWPQNWKVQIFHLG